MTTLEDKEDHVWIYESQPFVNVGIKVGDKVRFSGTVEPYRRKNGNWELGIVGISQVEIIENYAMPSDDEMKRQFLSQLRCELCLCRGKCYGFCLMDAMGRDNIFNF